MGITEGIVIPAIQAIAATFLVCLVFVLVVTIAVRYGDRPIYIRKWGKR